MPKLKPSDIEMKRRLAESVIAGAMKLQAIDNDALAVKLHIAPSTMHLRRRQPDGFRLEQLWRLVDAAKLSDNDILKLMGRNPDGIGG